MGSAQPTVQSAWSSVRWRGSSGGCSILAVPIAHKRPQWPMPTVTVKITGWSFWPGPIQPTPVQHCESWRSTRREVIRACFSRLSAESITRWNAVTSSAVLGRTSSPTFPATLPSNGSKTAAAPRSPASSTESNWANPRMHRRLTAMVTASLTYGHNSILGIPPARPTTIPVRFAMPMARARTTSISIWLD